MKKLKILEIFLLCIKILLPILIVIPLGFFSYRLVEGRMEDIANIGNESYHSGMGLYVFASNIVLLGANLVLSLIGLSGWIISKKYKSCPIQKKNIVIFRCLTWGPLCSQLLYILINLIVLNVK